MPRAAALCGLWAGLVLLAASTASAEGAGDLYRVTVFVTGQGEETRGPALEKALAAVLVKVAGDPRLAASPEVAALAPEAAGAVSGFAYRDRMAGIPVHDEQGSRDRPYVLTVDFDPAAIDALLARVGATPWPAPRPELLAVVKVENGSTRFFLAADGREGRDMREAMDAAAAQYGMPAVLPTRAELARAGDVASLRAAVGADAAVAGTLRWDDDALGWTVDWTLTAGGTDHSWTAEAVSFDAAFRVAIGGAAQILSGHGAPN
jgi:hypothetical protein